MSIPATRKYPRIRNRDRITVDYTERGRAYRGLARELGGGGLFIATPEPIAPNHELCVRFRPAQNLRPVKARAKVRYQIEGEGCGVEFTRILPQSREQILKVTMRRWLMGVGKSSSRFVAQVEHRGRTFLGHSIRFGKDGLLIQTGQALAAGSPVTVRFRPDDAAALTVASGEVIFAVRKLGIGVILSSAHELPDEA